MAVSHHAGQPFFFSETFFNPGMIERIFSTVQVSTFVAELKHPPTRTNNPSPSKQFTYQLINQTTSQPIHHPSWLIFPN